MFFAVISPLSRICSPSNCLIPLRLQLIHAGRPVAHSSFSALLLLRERSFLDCLHRLSWVTPILDFLGYPSLASCTSRCHLFRLPLLFTLSFSNKAQHKTFSFVSCPSLTRSAKGMYFCNVTNCGRRDAHTNGDVLLQRRFHFSQRPLVSRLLFYQEGEELGEGLEEESYQSTRPRG